MHPVPRSVQKRSRLTGARWLRSGSRRGAAPGGG